ncbi:4838_t:CDS:1, partial [Funneliformis mosseae]
NTSKCPGHKNFMSMSVGQSGNGQSMSVFMSHDNTAFTSVLK